MLEITGYVVLGFWETLVEMAPYLLFGFFVAGLLSVLISPETVERHLGRGKVWPVVKADGISMTARNGRPRPSTRSAVRPNAAPSRLSAWGRW